MAQRPQLTAAFFLLGLLLVAAAPVLGQDAPVLSAEDKADVTRAQAYLEAIHSLRSDFVQINPDGSLAHGTFYLKRPGRLRFAYEPPTPVLIVGDGTYLHYHDIELGQVNSFTLNDTPIAVIMREEIRFEDEVTVTRVERRPGTLEITLVDTDDPGRGELRLTFADAPLELRQWTVLDAQGQSTTVAFMDIRKNPPLDDALFVFENPHEAARPGRSAP
ncbi:MAG: outer membrane lipoprotein carrier protein LolA [Alphaproteobacteria bacterium]